MPREFAEDTTVPASRTRGEIEQLLTAWGAAVQWTIQPGQGGILRFHWSHPGGALTGRLTVRLPTALEVRRKSSRSMSAKVIEAAIAQEERALYRRVLLYVKAQLNAIQSGLLDPLDAFLGLIERDDGRTYGEIARASGSALADHGTRLLPDHRREG